MACLTENLEELGFLRVAVIAPELRVADVAGNVQATFQALKRASDEGVRLAVFPELGLSGYSCGDLFHQRRLLDAVREGLLELARLSAGLPLTFVVGLPLEMGGRLYNCAAVLGSGTVRGVVPKIFLPNSGEFYEKRWFAAGAGAVGGTILLGGAEIPFGVDLLFDLGGARESLFGVEICEDLWTVSPPSGPLALAGALLICNLSASDELLGKAPYRRGLVAQQSARCLGAYLYSSSGPGESTTDLVFSGHGIIAENGRILKESERFSFASTMSVTDVDLDRLRLERLGNSSFAGDVRADSFRKVDARPAPVAPSDRKLLREVDPHPFVPGNPAERAANCAEIFHIQTTGLMKRLLHTCSKVVVLGLSGGLDSTLALLVCTQAFDRLGWDRSGIYAPTMPGFGTSGRTLGNATRLAELLGVRCDVIPIGPAVEQHFRDIGHDPAVHDTTYENSQARERTQILMDLANQARGLVIGTGDLSEAALGWCTYNGDHMSMYHVNIGVPKTLVRHLVNWCADELFEGAAAEILRDICATPVSPELLPLAADGSSAQQTEETIGPYELHDFFLFQVVRCGFEPRKVFFLARQAFGAGRSPAELLRWLEVFYRRFFANQFKRSCMPDGPKVGSVALSPRGDWRMPSDACADSWLEELEQISMEIGK